jgi:hypothetical protein
VVGGGTESANEEKTAGHLVDAIWALSFSSSGFSPQDVRLQSTDFI